MSYEWNVAKAISNLKKHGVDFSDAIGALEDERALWQEDECEYGEERFVTVGKDYLGRVLTVVFTYRNDNIRLISARKATKIERLNYERGI